MATTVLSEAFTTYTTTFSIVWLASELSSGRPARVAIPLPLATASAITWSRSTFEPVVCPSLCEQAWSASDPIKATPKR